MQSEEAGRAPGLDPLPWPRRPDYPRGGALFFPGGEARRLFRIGDGPPAAISPRAYDGRFGVDPDRPGSQPLGSGDGATAEPAAGVAGSGAGPGGRRPGGSSWNVTHRVAGSSPGCVDIWRAATVSPTSGSPSPVGGAHEERRGRSTKSTTGKAPGRTRTTR